ncbi:MULTISPECIES: hypothetical protein [Corallococcus]|uniref:hypothetical protein n=1 Tax=Corallococcus TaxID=83461 RepID=UPI000ED4E58F|nr:MULTISPECIES: hypothetical protein [Corallococcus]NPC75617.1 hypothetical protein [Corallococcus exiguus]NPD23130.1 hypothetical protein [Corallococcus exiguus]NRD47229.1 hypothetical protein [Corallococcus exiguus]RKI01273.1 hypothetical protein D7Y04_12025 [Corallococcus sp. AB038B]
MFRLECEWLDAHDPDRTGFDLGHMTFTSDAGTCTSKGRFPDQAMMLAISFVGLLDGLKTLVAGSAKDHLFVGVDSSFSLRLKRAKKGRIAIQCGTVSLGEVESNELCRAVLAGVESFMARPESALPPGDAARGDLEMSLREFRAAVPGM